MSQYFSSYDYLVLPPDEVRQLCSPNAALPDHERLEAALKMLGSRGWSLCTSVDGSLVFKRVIRRQIAPELGIGKPAVPQRGRA